MSSLIGLLKSREFYIGDQYGLYILGDLRQGKLLIELHDFDNLMMYRDYVSQEEFEDMKLNPSKYI